MSFQEKYLKYKNKYLQLKNQIGGYKFDVGDEVIRKYTEYNGGQPGRTRGQTGKIIKRLPTDEDRNILYSIEFVLTRGTDKENTLSVAEQDLELIKKNYVKSLNILDIPKLIASKINTDTDADNFIINSGSDEDIQVMDDIFKKHNPKIEPYYIDIREPSIELTALMYQAHRGTLKAMKWLLDNGANINLQSTTGFTPLHWAVLSNDSNKVNLLLEQGADESICSKNGETPLELAKNQNRNEIINLLEAINTTSGDFVAQSGYYVQGNIQDWVYDVVVIDRKSGREAAVVAFSPDYKNGHLIYQTNSFEKDDKLLAKQIHRNYNGIIQRAKKYAIDKGIPI